MAEPAHVLVVDDERAIRDALIAALRDAGYRTTAVDGLESARRALSGAEISAVLLDVRLRDGNGLDLLDELRRQHPRLPVIMATAYGDSERTIAAMKSGAFDYVTKPFDLDLLLATLARAVQAPPVARVPAPTNDAGFVEAARRLGIRRALLYARMAHLGITDD